MEKLTIEQFGSTIKQKYPQYGHLSDEEVGRKTIAKYPQYQEKVEFSYDVAPIAKPVETPQQKIARYNQEQVVYDAKAKQEGSLTGMAKNFGKAFVSIMANSEVGLGNSLRKIYGNQSQTYNDALNTTGNTQANLVKEINKRTAAGQDATKLKQLYNEGLKTQADLKKGLVEESTLPTTGEVYGQIGGTALDVLTAGTYGKAKTAGMLPGRLSVQGSASGKVAAALPNFLSTAVTPAKQGVSTLATSVGLPELGQLARQKASGFFSLKGGANILKGTGIGYASDVTQGLQGARGENRKEENAFIPGLGTVIGASIPAINEGVQTVKNVRTGKTSADIMQRVARIPAQQQAKFQERAGESVGEYLTKRGIYGNGDEITEQLVKRVQISKGEVDTALAKLEGVNKFEPVKTALDDLLARETRISSPGANSRDLQRVQQLATKHDKIGLTMEEINEAKRLYERNVKLDFLKSQNTEGVARANNIDDAIRQWQLKQADKQGFKNLGELNRETYLAKQLANELGKDLAAKAGNNSISITDWILLAGGDPRAIGAFGVKRLFSAKKVQSGIAQMLGGKGTQVGLPTARFGGVTDLPAKIPGRDYGTTIELPGRKVPIVDEGMASRVNMRDTRTPQLALPPGRSNDIQPQTLRLPQSVRETNLGLDEVRNTTRATQQTLQPQETKSGISLLNKVPQTLETSRKLSTVKTLPKKKGFIAESIEMLKDPSKRQRGSITNPFGKRELPVSKSSSVNNTTDLLSEAKKYKSAEEFVNEMDARTVIKRIGDSEPFTAKLYHGTPDARFAEEFDPTRKGYFKDAPDLLPDNKQWNELYGKTGGGFKTGKGVYEGLSFSDDISVAKSYADKAAFDSQNSVPMVLERYITLKKPKVINIEKGEWKMPLENEIKRAKSEGYDGIIFKNIKDNYHPSTTQKPSNNVIVFNENSIKTKSQLEDIWKQAQGKSPSSSVNNITLQITPKLRENPQGFYKVALEAKVPEEIKPVLLRALGDNLDSFKKGLKSTKYSDVRAGLDYMEKNSISADDVFNMAQKEIQKPAVLPPLETRVVPPKYITEIQDKIDDLKFDPDTSNYDNEMLSALSKELKDMDFKDFQRAVKFINNSSINSYIKNELTDIVKKYQKVANKQLPKAYPQGKSLSNDLLKASVSSKLPPQRVPLSKPNFTPELKKNIAEIIDAQRGVSKVSPAKLTELEADMSSIIEDFGFIIPKTKTARLALLERIYKGNA